MKRVRYLRHPHRFTNGVWTVSDTFTKPKKKETLADLVELFRMSHEREMKAFAERKEIAQKITSRFGACTTGQQMAPQAVLLPGNYSATIRFAGTGSDSHVTDIEIVPLAE